MTPAFRWFKSSRASHMRQAIIDKVTKEELGSIVANSSNVVEVALKLGYTAKGDNYRTIRKRIEKYGFDISHFAPIAHPSIVRTAENVFMKDSTASQKVLRGWYKKGNYSPYQCAICGQLPIWNGKELTLTLDHINGNNKDNRLSNLRWVCPNCDRQLDTFAGKNLTKHNK